MSENIETRYFLDGKRYATRSRPYTPNVGDEIKFKTGLFVIVRKVWIENAANDIAFHCAVDIKPVTE